MLRLIRVSSCNSSSSTLLSRISLWFRRLGMLLALVCSVFDSLVLPRFCSGAVPTSLISVSPLLSPLPISLSSFRRSSFSGCCGRSFCFTPFFFALLRCFFFAGCTSYAFSSVFLSPVDLPPSSPRSILLLFQSESSVGVFVGMKFGKLPSLTAAAYPGKF